MSPHPANVILCDPHPLMHSGFDGLPEVCLLDAVVHPRDVVDTIARHSETYDVLVTELLFGVAADERGVTWPLEYIRSNCPGTRILVYTVRTSFSVARRAYDAGALGFLSKAAPVVALTEALQSTAKGERYMAPDLQSALATEQLSGEAPHSNHPDPRRILSETQFRLFMDTVLGRSPAHIAMTYDLKPKAVYNAKQQIAKRLGTDHADWSWLARKWGYLPLDL